MPEIPKPKRRQLKIEPEPEAVLAQLVLSLNAIAEGIKSIVDTLEALIEDTGDGPPAIRTVSK